MDDWRVLITLYCGLLVPLALLNALGFLSRFKQRALGPFGLPRRTQEALGVLQTFYEHAPTLLGVVELDGAEIRHVYDNPAACRVLGVADGRSAGKCEGELGISLEQTRVWRAHIDKSLAQSAPVRFEFSPRNEQFFAVTVCPVTHDGALRPQFCYLAEDISEWKNNADRARIDRERLQVALDAGRLGFWDCNEKTGQVIYGGAWSAMLGYPGDFFQPWISVWQGILHPDDKARVLDILQCALDGKTEHYEAEYRLKTSVGEWLWVSVKGRVVERDADEHGVRHVGVIEDIHERRQVREQLASAARQKDEFLATLAHELRNPLAPIRTGLTILKRDPTSEMAKQSREMMERQLLHLVRLIDDLLDISRISLGRLELKKARVTVKEVVDTALEVSSPFIGANHQTLVVEIPPEEIHLFGDLTRLAQVISNLLNNSAKYSQAGARIELRVSRLGQTVLFQVIDTGLGIPSSMIERIFDMFGQVDTTLDRAQGGLGIGLALVRQLVELHNGTVKAESPGEGQGSTFTVALPIELEPPSLATGTPKTIEPLLSMPRKILIVDDNQDAADSLAMYLRTEGHCVRVAYKPSVALEMVSQFKPEMVVLDIGLPEMSGYEVARAIRAEPALSKVILVALTGWGGEKDKENAKNAGFDAHLTKPVDPAAVQNILSGYFPPVG